jgi:3-deoxy-7-phosphoheptulonate synthase
VATLKKTKDTKGLPEAVVIDCSHGNSGKDYRNQGLVAESVAAQLSRGSTQILGVMLESNLVAGAQKLVLGKADQLVYGQSITDQCVDWEETVGSLRTLAKAVQRRRTVLKPSPKL